MLQSSFLRLNNPPPSHRRGIIYLYMVLCKLSVLEPDKTIPVEARLDYLARHKILRMGSI